MSQSGLPVADRWFTTTHVDEGVTLIEERHVDRFLRANTWHIRGTSRDLLVDSGLGVASMRELVLELVGRESTVFITHAHLDHMGSAHEFADIWAHSDEPLGVPGRGSLRGPRLAEMLGIEGGFAPLLVDALPHPTYDVDAYALLPATPTRLVHEGDLVDLGDRHLSVLHLPGHTHGSIALHDPDARTLYSGDVIYDDQLLDELPESDIAAYLRTMERLLQLDVDVVHPGHGDPFSGDRMREIAQDYIASRHQGANERSPQGEFGRQFLPH